MYHKKSITYRILLLSKYRVSWADLEISKKGAHTLVRIACAPHSIQI